ncbi:hypothetical protein [Larsenimonas suaedae]|uniref:TMhelix containing protein n=1 Tax=Larsenimonas suaedae TaxID=1851019 RepID=A0ABU1GUU0_9GAMM|nr:hypothetical protein [Larsenimonas suaedae]MCM2971788.1 hypothetical protein [Larsenimonas suaedae]MDR5895341.1 hypothetical protein [Larsenimonas suaedae]
MNWSDIGSIVSKTAPALGIALGGPMGGAIGTALASLLGADPTPESVKAAIEQDPEWALRAKELEADLQKHTLADKADARAMQVAELQQEDTLSKQFIYWFASVWSVFTMFYVSMISFMGVDESSQRFADTVLGFMLGTLIAAMIQFFFGSSRRDQEREKFESVARTFKDISDYDK